jgi:AmiR/NasT family two-component response regulator
MAPPEQGDDLGHRAVVHQAAGMVMIQLDVTIDEALLVLRSTAYAEGIPINELATEVVDGRRRITKEQP